jgi:hypothetical protein
VNCIRKIEIVKGDVYLSWTRFGISKEHFKNKLLSDVYKSGGQPALDKAIISMLLNDSNHMELSGEDPSILPYKRALKITEQANILNIQNKTDQTCDLYRPDHPFSKAKDSLREYASYRDGQKQEKLNTVVSFIVHNMDP